MQACDLERLGITPAEWHATETRDRALARECNHLRDELLECVYALNVAAPEDKRGVLERIKAVVALLEVHTDEVERAFKIERTEK